MTVASIRHAVSADAGVLGDVYRRSSLSNEGDRAALLSHPEALEFSALAVKEHRVRVAVIDERIVGFVRNGMTQTPFGPGHRMYIPVPRPFA